MGKFEALAAGEAASRAYVAGDAGDAGDAGQLEEGRLGVVLFHPWWGLNEDVVAYADRLADEGFVVVAPDLFGLPAVDGEAPAAPASPRIARTVEEAEQLASSLDERAADAFALAAIDRLGGIVGAGSRVGTIGFSMGAARALWSGGQRERVGATVVYYGTMGGPSPARSTAPVLGHFAERDPYEPEEQVRAFETALEAAGRKVVIREYPGTGHWFAEPSQDAFRPDEAELAFRRTISFLRECLSGA